MCLNYNQRGCKDYVMGYAKQCEVNQMEDLVKDLLKYEDRRKKVIGFLCEAFNSIQVTRKNDKLERANLMCRAYINVSFLNTTCIVKLVISSLNEKKTLKTFSLRTWCTKNLSLIEPHTTWIPFNVLSRTGTLSLYFP